MDLTDEQWEVLEPLIPEPPRRADGRGRPWRDAREVLNGILFSVFVVNLPSPCYFSITRVAHCRSCTNVFGSTHFA